MFGAKACEVLRSALSDLNWLLDRGYAIRSATTLVGDRHTLTQRQRVALARCACPLASKRRRERHRVELDFVRGRELWLDGFNVLTLLESALGGGIILVGRDGCCRDVAGVHRRYRKVEETVPALRLLGDAAREWGASRFRWWLDEPVSNSGRLKALVLDTARLRGWPWEVDLVFSPDHVLSRTDEVVVSSDSVILDRCQHWFNLARLIIAGYIPRARVVDLSAEGGEEEVKNPG